MLEYQQYYLVTYGSLRADGCYSGYFIIHFKQNFRQYEAKMSHRAQIVKEGTIKISSCHSSMTSNNLAEQVRSAAAMILRKNHPINSHKQKIEQSSSTFFIFSTFSIIKQKHIKKLLNNKSTICCYCIDIASLQHDVQ